MGEETFTIGLTDSDMIHLQNGGMITLNPKVLGGSMPDLPIQILYGGTPARMMKIMARHPESTTMMIETHNDKNN